MKILQVSKYFYPLVGGIESRVLSLASELVSRYHEVRVVTAKETGAKSRETVSGIDVYRSGNVLKLFNAPFNPGMFVNMLRADAEVIDVNLPDPVNSIFAFIASRIRGIPLVVTYHADIVRDRWYHKLFEWVYNPVLRFILERAEKIVVTSPDYAKSSPMLKGFRKRLLTVPNFVDVHRFNPDVKGSVIKTKHNLEGKKVVLFVGRLVPYKGIPYLIRAFYSIKSKYKKAALVIVGDGPMRKELEEMVAYFGIEDVVFAGKVKNEDLPKYYAACDVLVLPSVTRQEAFGITLVEAMACAKPVISTNMSGMPFVVGDCGLLVEPRDAEDLKSAILRVFRGRTLGKKLGMKGMKRAVREFSVEKVAGMMEKIYSEAVYGKA